MRLLSEVNGISLTRRKLVFKLSFVQSSLGRGDYQGAFRGIAFDAPLKRFDRANLRLVAFDPDQTRTAAQLPEHFSRWQPIPKLCKYHVIFPLARFAQNGAFKPLGRNAKTSASCSKMIGTFSTTGRIIN
jgi:hypothetical protein